MRGNLIYELAELDGFSRTESSRAKAFFSSRYDTFVPKYVAWAVKVPRQCVFFGTVNHGTYLRDTTGNRRYWPVRIERADIDSLVAARDQLWAEAIAQFNEGVRWWVTEEERPLFDVEQDLRYVGDAYEDLIGEWALGKSEITMAGVLAECLHLEKSKWTRAEQTRVGEVMASIGFEKRIAARRRNRGSCTHGASGNRARRADAPRPTPYLFHTYSIPGMESANA
jgi:putative DNA primase/helicase